MIVKKTHADTMTGADLFLEPRFAQITPVARMRPRGDLMLGCSITLPTIFA